MTEAESQMWIAYVSVRIAAGLFMIGLSVATPAGKGMTPGVRRAGWVFAALVIAQAATDLALGPGGVTGEGLRGSIRFITSLALSASIVLYFVMQRKAQRPGH